MSSFKNNLADFANMFKAFIGCNYLSISFAFKQSGLALGSVLLVLIVVVTEHCCGLIVKCKRIMLRRVFDSMPVEEDGSESPEVAEAKALMNKKTQMGDIGEYTFGRAGRVSVNIALFITQFGFCVNYFIFIGNTLLQIFPTRNETIYNASEEVDEPAEIIHYRTVSTAPNLIILVISPLPIFIGFSLLRSVRKLGFVSIVANLSICVGCVVIFSYIVSGFTVSDSFHWVSWQTAPVTIGLMVSAFEGIGTILPIEGSMVGNQHNFRRFLIGGIGGVALILAIFGVLGFLRYGAGTGQLLVQNIPDNNILSAIVDCTLIVGVIFTFPLQQVPVVTMVEAQLFTKGGLFHRRESESDDDQQRLLEEPASDSGSDIQGQPGYGTVGPEEDVEESSEGMHSQTLNKYKIIAPNWQRCTVRVIVVLAELGTAILMRNKYAYVSAFVGALGSCFLAFVVPCTAHLQLAWDDLSVMVKVKDFVIAIVGVMVSIISVTVTIFQIIKHP